MDSTGLSSSITASSKSKNSSKTQSSSSSSSVPISSKPQSSKQHSSSSKSKNSSSKTTKPSSSSSNQHFSPKPQSSKQHGTQHSSSSASLSSSKPPRPTQQGSRGSSSKKEEDSGIIRKKQIEIPAHLHKHKLTLTPAGTLFSCNGCKEQGCGLSYRCEHRDCSYVLHRECAKAVLTHKKTVTHPFFEGKILFRDFKVWTSIK
ncbi:hypothetical protein PIB30_002837 [Stylosanthes scabra]|uniref:DC1 domain-containing protein n=1 Tax=Stylosanthes scabra TaxID=79078 RepID=A0ABU6T3U5_9FABA|nr:hypothetical protein [Stylosanthes scabra]